MSQLSTLLYRYGYFKIATPPCKLLTTEISAYFSSLRVDSCHIAAMLFNGSQPQQIEKRPRRRWVLPERRTSLERRLSKTNIIDVSSTEEIDSASKSPSSKRSKHGKKWTSHAS